MRYHRIAASLAATAVTVLLAPATASAAPYPPPPPPASVSDGTVPPGGDVTFSGTGFLPFERITINVNYAGSNAAAAVHRSAGGFVLTSVELPRRAGLTVTADAHGSFSITLHLSQVGTATLVATGLTSGRTISATVKVMPPAHGGNGGQPGRSTPPGNGMVPDNGSRPDNRTALPTTGPSAAPLLVAVTGGAGLLVLGALVLWYTRRRSTGDRGAGATARPPTPR